MRHLRARCRELLIDRVTGDLTPDSERELQSILRQHPDWDTGEDLELAAAALHLSFLHDLDVLPPGLRQRLQDRAGHWPSQRDGA